MKRAHAALAAAGIAESRVKAEWILSELLCVPRWKMASDPDAPVDPALEQRIEEAIGRMVAREPLQYVLGTADFHGRRFRCDRRALIPRPETEELVEACLRHRNLWSRPSPRVVDIGTGTGCIAITLALERPKAEVIGVDLSLDALSLARENASRHGDPSGLTFREGDLLSGWTENSVDAVISNPPYLSTREYEELEPEIRDFEPRSALVAGEDGLSCIRTLVKQAFGVLRSGGILWLELGSTQAPDVRAILETAGFRSLEVARDLAGLWRIASGRKP